MELGAGKESTYSEENGRGDLQWRQYAEIQPAAAVYQEHENALSYLTQAGPVTLVLNVVMMAVAYLLARLFASGPRQRVVIAIECGVQNGTLAIAVATLLFGGGLAVVPAATYSIIMFATALIFIAFLRRQVPVS